MRVKKFTEKNYENLIFGFLLIMCVVLAILIR
jgi:hypothetical protein